MLAGRQVFGGEEAADSLAAIVRAEPEWSTLPAGTPAEVRKLLRRCLEKDPRSRLQAIGEARIILEQPPAPDPQPLAGLLRANIAYDPSGTGRMSIRGSYRPA